MEFAQRLLSTRRGTTMLGILAAAIAGILLLVYISQYRNSVNSSNKAVQVLVARSLIQKGTPGDVIGTNNLFQATSIVKDQVRNGAFIDASSLRGKVATADIFPGQQLTASEFAPASVTTVSTKLTGNLRAISVPVDGAHGLVGQVAAGDHVDVYAGWTPPSRGEPVIKEIMHNALVLRGAGSAGGIGSSGSNIVLRASAREVAQFAWASDNGKIWIILRPSANASNPSPPFVTSETLLKDVK